MARISFESVSKSFDRDRGPWAVRDLSLEIEDGELVVFVGPSGCGKSTTLRMLAGLEQVSSGEIRIGGRNVTRLPPKDRDIAMVFQNYALYPQKSVYENMAFGLRVRGEANDEIEKRVREAARTATSSAVWPLVRSRDRTRVRIGERSRGAPQNGIDLEGRLLRAKSTLSKRIKS